jgi:hypothetical protein
MNTSKAQRERLAAQLQSAHQDRANALIERRVRLAELEALHWRIEELDEYVQSLTRALAGPAVWDGDSVSSRLGELPRAFKSECGVTPRRRT